MASYATVAERLCADLGGPVTASAESLSLVDYRTILLARATRDAATAAAAAAAWELAQVLPGGWVCVLPPRTRPALLCPAQQCGTARAPLLQCPSLPSRSVRRSSSDNLLSTLYSVAEWLARRTQAQKGLGSNRSRDAVGQQS